MKPIQHVKTPYTPGPWSFNGLSTITAQDDLICIAGVDNFEWQNKEDAERRTSNALLIAASPDLREACDLALAFAQEGIAIPASKVHVLSNALRKAGF